MITILCRQTWHKETHTSNGATKLHLDIISRSRIWKLQIINLEVQDLVFAQGGQDIYERGELRLKAWGRGA